jgi:hypothetical protein
MNTRLSWCRKAVHRGIVQPLSRLSLALFLTLTGQFSIPCYAGGTGDDKHVALHHAKNVFAGLVVHVQRWKGSRNIRILLDRVPLTSKGLPLCNKPTGKLLSVLSAKTFSRRTEPSAFVVMPDPADPLPKHLSVGDCLTVDGNDVDKVDLASPKEEDSIRIVRSLDNKKSGLRIVRGLFFQRWKEKRGIRDILPENTFNKTDKNVFSGTQKWKYKNNPG